MLDLNKRNVTFLHSKRIQLVFDGLSMGNSEMASKRQRGSKWSGLIKIVELLLAVLFFALLLLCGACVCVCNAKWKKAQKVVSRKRRKHISISTRNHTVQINRWNGNLISPFKRHKPEISEWNRVPLWSQYKKSSHVIFMHVSRCVYTKKADSRQGSC